MIERLLLPPTPVKSGNLPPQAKAEKFLRWATGHRSLQAPPLSDEAVSRDSIYTREDEML
jgi:hypothetical protein